MAAAASVFHRVRTGSKLGNQYDQDGNVIQVETREDEEQSIKLTEILELLVAAGYFRARIKGLSPFDKVVGGMTWCVTTCNFDIDVDLLFQENSTIGQKIALTEKIVSVLPKMKCPHRLEPHQIQGLDFIHIFPVIQWLVKRAIETREEMGDYVRAFSISQFQKTHRLPEDEEFFQRKDKGARALLDVLEVYKPQRKYRRQREAGELLDEESRVHSTLLEYGRRFGFSKQAEREKVRPPSPAPSGTSPRGNVFVVCVQEDERKASASGLSQGAPEVSEEEELQEAEEKRIKSLMTNMAAMVSEEGRLTASAVGQIVGLQSAEIKQMASEYAEKQGELSEQERPDRFGPLQQHRRAVASLEKQIQQRKQQLEELQVRHAEMKSDCEEAKGKLVEATEHSERLDKQLRSLEEKEQQTNSRRVFWFPSLPSLFTCLCGSSHSHTCSWGQQRSGEAEGPRDHEREPEAAGAGLQDALQRGDGPSAAEHRGAEGGVGSGQRGREGAEPADGPTVRHRPGEAAEDPTADGSEEP
ncbi:coiled-coil domain-containing protein 93 isoform X4 [Takifugu flavidus]|uniref:coiled-coil domain-containing protein 93 isoform X4 n=1 Tax=Takifugu flavidus TaxID=433684 RepID=UPI002544738D|nr:coiled-coil domain-containing protein 93 isoform X4 [Takifugu flavidus]